MPALDTNVLVRYLVQDDEAQSAAAQKLIRQAVAEQQTLHVPVTVTLEFEWVLRSAYGFSKQETCGALASLLSAAELSFEAERDVLVALHLCASPGADFADCLHIALAARAGEQPLWTFDKAASRIAGAQLVGR